MGIPWGFPKCLPAAAHDGVCVKWINLEAVTAPTGAFRRRRDPAPRSNRRVQMAAPTRCDRDRQSTESGLQETGGLSIRWVVPDQPSAGGQPDQSAAILIDVSYQLKHSGRERQIAKALGLWIVLVQRFARSNPDFARTILNDPHSVADHITTEP